MIKQKHTSAGTSISTVSKIFTSYDYDVGSTILDYGGGKYDKNKEYMEKKNCMLAVYDPYNRTKEHNEQVLDYVKTHGVDYITCSNVLNVIDSIEVIDDVLKKIHYLANISTVQMHKPTTILFTVYEKNKNGIPEITSRGFQRNQPWQWYLKYIEKYFTIRSKSNGIIECVLNG